MRERDQSSVGERVRAVLTRHGLNVMEGAMALGVSRQQLSNVIHGSSGVSTEMALRLEQVFGEDAWAVLQQQVACDLHQMRARMPRLSQWKRSA